MTESEGNQLPAISKLWNFSDPAASEQAFRDARDKAQQADNQAFALELTTQIARAQGLQRKFDEAHQTLDETEPRLADAPAKVRVRYLLERGRVFNSSQQKDKSLPLFKEAWDVAGEAGEDNLAIDAAHMLGIVESPDEALRWNERAMQLAESADDPACRKWLGSLYNNIGWTYHDKNEFSQALELFQKALAWREEQGEAETIRIARWSVARALRSLNRTQEALEIQEKLLAEHEATQSKDGYVFEELAECHFLLDHEADAKKYFGLAYQELSQDDWLTSNEPDRIARLKKLGGVE